VRLTGHLVEVLVEDDGKGVPRELRDCLFDPFVSGATPGVGLGLSFARWGVERLGGSLTLEPESSLLGGANFRVTLPVAAVTRRSILQSTATRANRATTPKPPPLAGLTVAIIDDDAAVRQTFAKLLRRSGAQVLEMDPLSWSSPLEAVETIRAERLDIVLLDLNLRTLSVEETFSLLKARAHDLAEQVVFFTGGPVPAQGIDRPVLSKMLAWDDFVSFILGAVRPRT
jgi:CheY-like chemotaxis protein